MCGIAGLWQPSGLDRDAGEHLRRMTDTLRHRGPDGGGTWTRPPGIALGHRRLAIIDLAGGAPADVRRRTARCASSSTARSTTSASCARELEAARPPLPHRTATPRCSSTATRSGATSCVARLDGMFAFALWDARRARLHPGARPLRREAALLRARPATGALLFASELKALLALPGASPRRSTARRVARLLSPTATCRRRAASSRRAQAAARGTT